MKLKNKNRLLRVAVLITMFDRFTQLRLFERLFSKNERMTDEELDAFSSIFNNEIDFKSFKQTEDEEANKCIKLHSELEHLIANYCDFPNLNLDESTVKAFLNFAENKMFPLKVYHLMYADVIGVVLSYSMGVISKEDLFQTYSYYENQKFPISPLNKRSLYWTCRQVEKHYNEISYTRYMRKWIAS